MDSSLIAPFPKGYIVYPTHFHGAETLPEWFTSKGLNSSWTIKYDPLQEVHTHAGPFFTLTLVGRAYSKSFSAQTNSEIISVLVNALTNDFNVDRFITMASSFGGRFTIFLIWGESIVAVGDALGSMPLWWGVADHSIALTNYSSLLATLLNDFRNDGKKEFFGDPNYNSGQPWLSGLVPEHDVATPVIPNHYLEHRKGKTEHKRFFPTAPLQTISVEDAATIVIDELRYSVECLVSSKSDLYFSITGGDDAYAAVCATLDQLHSKNAIGVTYAFLNGDANPTHDDLVIASKRMFNAGLRHKVVPMEFSWGSDFAKAYSKTHPSLAVFPTLAATIQRTAQADSFFLVGHGAEIGNVFYKERTKSFPSIVQLAEKNGTRKFAESAVGQRAMRDYIDYTDLNEEAIFGYDAFDILYWENRVGRWGARTIGEWDFGSRPISPFSSRTLLSAMMSIPFESRLDREIYKEIHRRCGSLD